MTTALTCIGATDLTAVLEGLRYQGYAVVRDFLPPDMLAELCARLPRAYDAFRQAVPAERLAASGERGIVRLPMLFDPYFLKVLELPHLLSVVDATVGSTAILHLQNGFLTPPRPTATADAFQEKFHPDFPRVVGGVLLSINIFVALDDFTKETGCTQVVPGTHQQTEPPSQEYLEAHAVHVEGPAGTALVFDSTLYHRGGWNQTDHPRMAMNMQFTKSYLRQQLDYPRALPRELTEAVPERTRQLLGFYVRVPSSLGEYYVPPAERLYRAAQG